MALPPREQWGDSGNLFLTFCNLMYIFSLFLFCLKIDSKISKCRCRSRRPANLWPYERRQPVVAASAAQDEGTKTLAELENHLECLTVDIPETTIDDIPIRL